MDNFHEHLVAKKSTGADTAKKAGLYLAAVLIGLVLVLFLSVFFPINFALAGVLLYLAYYLASGLDVEYEYTFTNGDIDIDKIMGKRKRKRLVTASVKLFDAFGRMEDAPDLPAGTTIVKASDNTGEGEYFADFNHEKFGNMRIIFTPDEEMIDNIAHFLKGNVRAELKRQDFLKKRDT